MARVSTVLDADDPAFPEGRARRPGSHDRPEPGVIHRIESILGPSAAARGGSFAQHRGRPAPAAGEAKRARGR